MVVGALLDCEGSIVLLRDQKTGAYHLPEISVTGGSAGPSLLQAKLSSLGWKATISFVFAVFEMEEERKQFIYYRGTAEAEGISQECFFDREDIPWDLVRDETTKTMLCRYLTERDEGAFGVYSGSGNTGQVARLTSDRTSSATMEFGRL